MPPATNLDDSDRILAAVASIRAAIPDVQAIYRFGSTAAGTDGPGSDLDLAVLGPQPLDPVVRFDLQDQLASLVRRPVDLVDLRTASTVMAMQVLAAGELLHDSAPESRGLFEDRAYGSYARLNEERRGILARVAAEGTVYGR
ncbi:MAG: nucleotidyltransferase domain-containing protein [Acidobacteriota bacterium]|nr:nucleotidyltransferase domain-containing protein [Acidobacteriota bacterium]